MEKIWLKNYPQGVPETIDADEYPSIAHLFESFTERYADKPAFSNMGVTFSFAELNERATRFAGYCQQELKLKPGDRLALMMPNVLQYPVALFGALKAGLTVINVNPMYTPRELEHQLKDSGADAIVILANFAHTLEKVIKHTEVEKVVVTEIGDICSPLKRWLVNFVVRHIKKMVPSYQLANTISWPSLEARSRECQFEPVEVRGKDIAFLQYTGGTTGVAKGAVLTHRNIVANAQQVLTWLKTKLSEGEETIITALPLYHIFSLSVNCISFALLGSHNVLITNPRDMKGFVKTLQETPFTSMTGVNTLFNGLLNTPGFDEVDFSRLKVSLGGGTAVQKDVAERWQNLTGSALLEGYGLTETSPVVSINPLVQSAYNGTIGMPIPSTEISLRDESGNEVVAGEPGELFVRGPQVMRGYLGRPGETHKVLSEDGWLATGDMAIMQPDGNLKLVDRKKDMILVSGFNVYPNEIEDVVVSHPDVIEAAAIGIPDEHSGEAVKIFVVSSNPELTEADLLKHCKEQLTGYKRPKSVEFMDELPKSNVGKILRKELRPDSDDAAS